ncbi:hypothetical protein SDC9_185805 [bioreactor metagenome]|uniref:LysR substrate-binding domain-containing protein n=1 Tax=bioreactor metagenome TaxID=1076179 RepID=A0A645HGY1_9ZZZZ
MINDQIHDLVASQVDLAIHITSSPLEDHVATRVCDIHWGLFCTPEYLAQAAVLIRSPADLKLARLITPLNQSHRLELRQGGEVTQVQCDPFIQSGDYQFLFNAAMEGLGVALLPRYAVQHALQRGQLVQVLETHQVKGVGSALYIVRAPNRQPSAATLALIDLLVSAIAQMAPSWSVPLPA